jgi:hypothetical protein
MRGRKRERNFRREFYYKVFCKTVNEIWLFIYLILLSKISNYLRVNLKKEGQNGGRDSN